MEYMEVPVFPGEGTCSDNACPCGFPGAAIPRGTGYMYVSEDVVEFRRDAPSMLEAERKINRTQEATGTRIIGAAGVFAPILMCELGAKKRDLDLAVAAEDARHWWEHGEVPLRATPSQGAGATDTRRVGTPAGPAVEPVKTHSVPPHDGAFGLELTKEHQSGVDRVVDHAAEQGNALRKKATLRWWLSGGLYVLAIGLPIALGIAGIGNGGLLFALAVFLFVTAVAVTVWVSRINGRASTKIADEALATIEAEGLPRWPIVDALNERLQGSTTDSAMLTVIDPDATRMLELRQRGLAALDDLVAADVVPVKITLQFNSSNGQLQSAVVHGEEEAAAFRTLALDYLDAGAPCEALAAIAVAATTYGRIAPPGMRDKLRMRANLGSINLPGGVDLDLDDGGTVEVVGGTIKQGAQGDIVGGVFDVFSGFTFAAEARSILASMDRRRELSIVESLALMAKGGGSEAMAQLADVLQEGGTPVTADPTFVGQCVDHLNNLSPPAMRVLGLNQMCWIPDRSVVPSLFELFELVPFYPAGIDAIARFGADVALEVSQRFSGARSSNARFNLALALGILGYEAARPAVTGMLDQSSNTTERLGCHYALARWGDEDHIIELVAGLDEPNADVRHAAAICVEHLPARVPDQAFLRHIDDSNPLVRLRLTRKLGEQGTQDQKLAEMLVGRLADGNEDVRDAASEAIGALPFDLVGDLVLEMAGPGHDVEERAAAVETLGKFDAPGVEDPLLGYATAPKHPVKVRRAAIAALGERGSVAAIDPLAEMLTGKVPDYHDSARIALIRIGAADTNALLNALPAKRDSELDGIRAVLGDAKAKERVGKQLGRWRSMDPAALASVLTTARMMGDPDFEPHLRGMLDYERPANFPGDRLIGQWAFGALAQSLTRRAVQR